MAQARVELSSGKSFTTKGITFVKGKPRTVTNNDDIAHFRRCPQLKVTMQRQTVEAAPPSRAPSTPLTRGVQKPAKNAGGVITSERVIPETDGGDPMDEPLYEDGDEDEEDEGEDPAAAKFLPWKPTDNKAKLQAACESRNIAYTPDDKAAVLVQMLKEHGELSS